MRPYLSISYEKVHRTNDCEHYRQSSRRFSRSIQNVRFIIVDKGRSYKVLGCLSEDLIDFCNRIYLSSFLCDCFGTGTAHILGYNFLENTLVSHGVNGFKVKLTAENVEDIKTIANPNYTGDGCLLY